MPLKEISHVIAVPEPPFGAASNMDSTVISILYLSLRSMSSHVFDAGVGVVREDRFKAHL